MTSPVPIGPGASFANVKTDSVATGNFTMSEGLAIVTFNPVDDNAPGTATLYDSDGNTVLTMTTGGHELVQVPYGGKTYYFKATLGANMLAMTQPTIWR